MFRIGFVREKGIIETKTSSRAVRCAIRRFEFTPLSHSLVIRFVSVDPTKRRARPKLYTYVGLNTIPTSPSSASSRTLSTTPSPRQRILLLTPSANGRSSLSPGRDFSPRYQSHTQASTPSSATCTDLMSEGDSSDSLVSTKEEHVFDLRSLYVEEQVSSSDDPNFWYDIAKSHHFSH